MTQGAAGEHSSAGVSTVFPLLARSPPPSRQPHPLGLSSLLPPAPPPPFQARPWPPNSRSSLRERAAARRFSRASGGGGSAPTFATQGQAAWAPTTGLRRVRVSLPAEGSAVCVCVCVCVPVVSCVSCVTLALLCLSSRHRLSLASPPARWTLDAHDRTRTTCVFASLQNTHTHARPSERTQRHREERLWRANAAEREINSP